MPGRIRRQTTSQTTREPTRPRSSERLGQRLHAVVVALVLVLLGGLGPIACSDSTHRPAPGAPGDDRLYPESRRVPRASADDLALRRPAPARIVAIGDLHGDRERTLRALRLAGAVDGQGDWSGGSLVVVQTGALVNERADIALLGRRLVANVNLIKALGGGWEAQAPVSAAR